MVVLVSTESVHVACQSDEFINSEGIAQIVIIVVLLLTFYILPKLKNLANLVSAPQVLHEVEVSSTMTCQIPMNSGTSSNQSSRYSVVW